MKTGISEGIWGEITEVFEKFPKINQVILFGSRAMGNFREGADIDLAVMGDLIVLEDLLDIEVALEDLELIYKFDLVDFNKINNHELTVHIERVGMVVYSRKMNEIHHNAIKSS